MTSFDDVRALADTVLYEGYALYPYRSNDAKNAVRFQFGVLMPPAVVAVEPSERDRSQTECLLEDATDGTLSIRVRFLQLQHRSVQARRGAGFEYVDELTIGDTTHRPWDEAVEQHVEVEVAVANLLEMPIEQAFQIPAGIDHEPLLRADTTVGRLTRTRDALSGLVRVEAERLPGPYGVLRLRAQVDNVTAYDAGSAESGRPGYLRRALIATHVVARVAPGRFVSLLDPPEWARGYAAACDNIGTFPVLAGEPGSQDMILSSPIILYDHAQVAPESRTEFFDGTEIDEMLTLRTLTMTGDELREARGTDPRIDHLLKDVDAMPPELMDRLHGTIRYLNRTTGAEAVAPPARPDPVDEPLPWWDPGQDASVSPETDGVEVGGVRLAKGSRVLLRPGDKRADAQDMFLVGRQATIAAVFSDVDGGTHLAVVPDDDPAPDLMHAHGRYLYFTPAEVEPLEGRP